MALVLKDRIKQQTTTTGTTDAYALSGSFTGFETFAEIGDGNTTYYCCTDGTDFEIGIGTFTASGTTLARTTILQSSNSDAAVNWTSGTRTIFCTQPAEKAVFKNASGHVDIDDNEEIRIGTGNDLRLYHSGTLSYITNKTGNFVIGANDPDDVGGDLILRAKVGEVDTSLRLQDDGFAQIYSNGTISAQFHSSQIFLEQDALLRSNRNLIFEGATNDDNETTLTATDPTSDRTITLPDATGTVALDESTGMTLNNGVIALKNGGTQSEVRLYCESSNAHYAALKAPAHSALQTSGNTTLTLPAVTTGTLVSTGDTGSVATSMIADNAVNADKLNDIAGVSGSYTAADITVDGQGRITAASNGSGGGGGSASDSFKTIAVTGTAGQSDVVASSSTDTLTFVAGSNMTITTDASTDTITFASSGGGGGGGGISTGKAIAMAMIFG